jgi:hypothetical protein
MQYVAEMLKGCSSEASRMEVDDSSEGVTLDN